MPLKLMMLMALVIGAVVYFVLKPDLIGLFALATGLIALVVAVETELKMKAMSDHSVEEKLAVFAAYSYALKNESAFKPCNQNSLPLDYFRKIKYDLRAVEHLIPYTSQKQALADATRELGGAIPNYTLPANNSCAEEIQRIRDTINAISSKCSDP